jgi:hypothetical protein
MVRHLGLKNKHVLVEIATPSPHNYPGNILNKQSCACGNCNPFSSQRHGQYSKTNNHVLVEIATPSPHNDMSNILK